MARTTSVTLGEPLNDFVNEMVASGRYGSTSEVVRTALRMLEEKEQYLAQLRQAIDDGDASGYATETIEEMMLRVKAELNV
ncbi:TPA: type II toxin-antitoxin system ParD family antitoxin [Mannheimia haemolytica]